MKCQNLFTGKKKKQMSKPVSDKNRKDISIHRLLKNFLRLLSVTIHNHVVCTSIHLKKRKKKYDKVRSLRVLIFKVIQKAAVFIAYNVYSALKFSQDWLILDLTFYQVLGLRGGSRLISEGVGFDLISLTYLLCLFGKTGVNKQC